MTNVVFKNRQQERRTHKKVQNIVANVTGSQIIFEDVRKEIQR